MLRSHRLESVAAAVEAVQLAELVLERRVADTAMGQAELLVAEVACAEVAAAGP